MKITKIHYHCPLRIGLITSPEGAAKEDFISILKEENGKV